MLTPTSTELATCSVALSGGSLADVLAVGACLELCERLGQLQRQGEGDACVGAVAWLRGGYSRLEALRRADTAELEAIPEDELRGGPVICIAEVVATAPGWAYNVVRKLKHLPGVEYWCGWRDRVRWAEGKVRRSSWA